MNVLEERINKELTKIKKAFPVFKDLPPFTFKAFKKDIEKLRKKDPKELIKMAISVSELIGKRDEIKNKKGNLYELETSIGNIVAKIPSTKVVTDAFDMSSNMEGNQLLILECVISPNLKDKELQQAYECVEPIDIVPALFQSGEISRIASALLKVAGFTEDVKIKLFKETKNL